MPPHSVPAGQRCAARLRQLITVGELDPGQQLVETALAERLGVSRNTLREGFRELAQEGLVRHEPHRGVFVAAPTAEDVRRLYTARRVLECGVLVELAEGGLAPSREAVDHLTTLTEEAREAAHCGDWVRVGDLNMAFHGALVGLARAEAVDHVSAAVLAHARLAFRSLEVPAPLHAHFVEDNSEIARMVRDGRWAEAATTLRAYLRRAEAELLEGLA